MNIHSKPVKPTDVSATRYSRYTVCSNILPSPLLLYPMGWWWVMGVLGAFKFLWVKLKALSLSIINGEKKKVPILLLSKCMQLLAKAFMSLCNLCQWQWPQNILVLLYSFAAGEHTVHLAQSTLVYGGLPSQKPLDVLMCEIMLLWDNIHSAWLADHMQPYLPNGFLIWVDRSTIGSSASIVMHLTRNKAEINFPWSLCGAFWMALCLCLREHLLHFCWPLCPFPPWAYRSHWNDNCFSICGHKTTRHTFQNSNVFQST